MRTHAIQITLDTLEYIHIAKDLSASERRLLCRWTAAPEYYTRGFPVMRPKDILTFAHKPKLCFFCSLDVDGLSCTPNLGKWTIHHLDERKYNNKASNLAWAHEKCHLTYHSRATL